MSVIGKDLKKNTAYTIKFDQKCFSIKQEAGQGSVNYREQQKKRYQKTCAGKSKLKEPLTKQTIF